MRGKAKGERKKKRDVHPQYRKCKQRLVQPAHHDADLIVPPRDAAHMAQGLGAPPGEQRERDGPEDGQRAVERDVQARDEAVAQVEEGCEGEAEEGEEGGREELRRK